MKNGWLAPDLDLLLILPSMFRRSFSRSSLNFRSLFPLSPTHRAIPLSFLDLPFMIFRHCYLDLAMQYGVVQRPRVAPQATLVVVDAPRDVVAEELVPRLRQAAPIEYTSPRARTRAQMTRAASSR